MRVEADNLKLYVCEHFPLSPDEAAQEALTDMPPRSEEVRDGSVSQYLHNRSKALRR